MNSITPPGRPHARHTKAPLVDGASPRRVAVYARVSTGKQAEQDLSIPDQLAQAEAWAAQKGAEIVARFVEPGASATDDRRPEFQKMIDAATAPDRPFDTVVVHSMSRFFRDQYLCEMYLRKLAKAGVAVVSITQNFADDPTGQLIRKVVGIFDEYQSAETSKHTTRAMKENARQGFWNGSRTPFGYRTEAAEQRGAKIKKRLVIDETEASVVRYIFNLALGRHGPTLGVKAIVNRLNGERIGFRGKRFQISNVHRLLTSHTYIGEHVFNQRHAKSGTLKPREEWIVSAVPAIVDREAFEQIQASLEARNPKRTPPRIVNGPTLLTGIARCATCGSGMTMRTGKSGRYRYYTCAGCAQKGKTHCSGRSISMPKLDDLVIGHLSDRLFTPARLRKILEAYVERSADAQIERTRKIAVAKQRQTEIGGKINRLLQLVANGAIESDDPDLAAQIRSLKAERGQTAQEIKLLEQAAAAGNVLITDARLARFGEAIRAAVANPDPAFRKAYLRLFVDAVTIGDKEIVVTGPKAALAKAASSEGLPNAAATVPSFVREWYPVPDSNRCCRRERAVS